LDTVTGRDVTDLMGEHTRELGTVLGALDETTREIDMTPRQREGVHYVGIDDVEAVVEVRPLADLGQTRADGGDIRPKQGLLDDRGGEDSPRKPSYRRSPAPAPPRCRREQSGQSRARQRAGGSAGHSMNATAAPD
jgi:hypothetical protein